MGKEGGTMKKALRIMGYIAMYPVLFGLGMIIRLTVDSLYFSQAIDYVNFVSTILFNK